SVQPGFVARGVREFMEQDAVIVLATSEMLRGGHPDEIPGWRIKRPIKAAFDLWTLGHGVNDSLGFNDRGVLTFAAVQSGDLVMRDAFTLADVEHAVIAKARHSLRLALLSHVQPFP